MRIRRAKKILKRAAALLGKGEATPYKSRQIRNAGRVLKGRKGTGSTRFFDLSAAYYIESVQAMLQAMNKTIRPYDN